MANQFPKIAVVVLAALASITVSCRSDAGPTITPAMETVDPETRLPDDAHTDQIDLEEDEGDQLSDEERAAVLANPFTGDEERTKAGAVLYQQNCATCHGETGAGDGPSADGLESPPGDLGANHVQEKSDGELFYIITSGLADSSMPAWEAVLDEDERWAVVNFLRTFKEPSG